MSVLIIAAITTATVFLWSLLIIKLQRLGRKQMKAESKSVHDKVMADNAAWKIEVMGRFLDLEKLIQDINRK